MNEKKDIERATADAFIELYNTEMGTSFSITEYSDSPDIRCKDKDENEFNFEITLTEDRPNDIQAALGRSDHRRLENIKKNIDEVNAGKANLLDIVSCLQGNVTDMIVHRINAKLNKDYGSNVALVIRDTSPIDWSWNNVREQIVARLNLKRNPFDKGIWIISYSRTRDKLFRIL